MSMDNTDKAQSLGLCQPALCWVLSSHSSLPMVYRGEAGSRLPPSYGLLDPCKPCALVPELRLTIPSLQAASNGVPLLIVGRITAGIGIGIASTMVPVYQAEIVSAKLWDARPPSNFATGSERNPRPGGLVTTMGHYLGYSDPVLHPVRGLFHRRRSNQCSPGQFGLPHSMGGTGCAGCCPLYRDVLLALYPQVACSPGSLGGSHSRACKSARQR